MKNIHKLNGFIYVTSEDEIKEGDYYIDFMCDGLKLEHFKTKEDWVLVGICNSKKVILTNDRKLTNVQKLTHEEEAYCKTVDSVEVVKWDGFSDWDSDNTYQLQLPKKEQVLIQSSIDGDVIWREGCTEEVKILYTEEEVRLMLSESFKASHEGYYTSADKIINQFNQNKKK